MIATRRGVWGTTIRRRSDERRRLSVIRSVGRGSGTPDADSTGLSVDPLAYKGHEAVLAQSVGAVSHGILLPVVPPPPA